MHLALPMLPRKVLAQVEPEHLDGPASLWVDAPSCDEPAALRRATSAAEDARGPGAGTAGGRGDPGRAGPAELNDGEDPPSW